MVWTSPQRIIMDGPVPTLRNENNLIDIAIFFFDNGVNTDNKDNPWMDLTALATLTMSFLYTNYNLIELVKLLFIENGIDVTSTMGNGWTALHFLCQTH